MIRDAHKILESLKRMMMITNIITELAPVLWSSAPAKMALESWGHGSSGEPTGKQRRVRMAARAASHGADTWQRQRERDGYVLRA